MLHATLTSIPAVSQVVEARPGHTAYWYGLRVPVQCRWDWVYSAFERAVRHGDVKAVRDGSRTIYLPAD